VRLLSIGERPIKRALPRRETKNRELAVMGATFHRIGPLAGLTVALAATVGWIGLLGYVAIKLF
jgi:hypothetical protein